MIMVNKGEYISYIFVAQDVSQMSCRLNVCRPSGLSPKRLYTVCCDQLFEQDHEFD